METTKSTLWVQRRLEPSPAPVNEMLLVVGEKSNIPESEICVCHQGPFPGYETLVPELSGPQVKSTN